MDHVERGPAERAELAWYCSHHHNAAGQNVDYSYSYLYGYVIDLPATVRSVKLSDNDSIRILAISVADESSRVKPARPLYDVLPSPNSHASDFSFSASTGSSE